MAHVRRCGAAFALALVVAITAWPSAPAGAAQQGACTDRVGVTVVVDFTDLGGGVVVRCAGPLGDGADGFEALAAAGFQVTQPLRTLGFVCRIDGLPAPSDDSCVDTPPTSAYWSYWTASRGGSWRYSSLGASARTVEPGGVEGWAFAEDRTANAVPAPRIAPPAPIPSTPGSSTPAAPATTQPTRQNASPRPGVAGVTTTRPLPTIDPMSATRTGPPTTGTTVTGDPTAATTTTGPGSTTTTTSVPDEPERVAVTTAGSGEPDGGGGSGAATAAVVVLVAALGAGAVTTARRRAARSDDDRSPPA